jgi:hypothetical protein
MTYITPRGLSDGRMSFVDCNYQDMTLLSPLDAALCMNEHVNRYVSEGIPAMLLLEGIILAPDPNRVVLY